MTDDLVKRLLVAPADGLGTENLCIEAADRIEALERERERLGREVNMARYGQPDFAWSIHKAAMADLQASLAKAVEALRTIADAENWQANEARAVLAELDKGEK